jgi:hypothetical protein
LEYHKDELQEERKWNDEKLEDFVSSQGGG